MPAVNLIGMYVLWLAVQTHAEEYFLCRLGRLADGLGLGK